MMKCQTNRPQEIWIITQNWSAAGKDQIYLAGGRIRAGNVHELYKRTYMGYPVLTNLDRIILKMKGGAEDIPTEQI